MWLTVNDRPPHLSRQSKRFSDLMVNVCSWSVWREFKSKQKWFENEGMSEINPQKTAKVKKNRKRQWCLLDCFLPSTIKRVQFRSKLLKQCKASFGNFQLSSNFFNLFILPDRLAIFSTKFGLWCYANVVQSEIEVHRCRSGGAR
jgi:hypothetical protein